MKSKLPIYGDGAVFQDRPILQEARAGLNLPSPVEAIKFALTLEGPMETTEFLRDWTNGMMQGWEELYQQWKSQEENHEWRRGSWGDDG